MSKVRVTVVIEVESQKGKNPNDLYAIEVLNSLATVAGDWERTISKNEGKLPSGTTWKYQTEEI